MSNRPTVTIENGTLIFRNFAGEETQYNRKGQRSFAVLLEDHEELVRQLEQDQWKIRYTKEREEGDIPIPYLPVEARFDNYPPNIWLINSSGRTRLTEDMVETLDYADIAKVDLVVNPYDWTRPDGTSGRKAYLKTMFVTINEDDLEKKYAMMDEPEMERDR